MAVEYSRENKSHFSKPLSIQDVYTSHVTPLSPWKLMYVPDTGPKYMQFDRMSFIHDKLFSLHI